jgi:hypothetical protein
MAKIETLNPGGDAEWDDALRQELEVMRGVEAIEQHLAFAALHGSPDDIGALRLDRVSPSTHRENYQGFRQGATWFAGHVALSRNSVQFRPIKLSSS